MLHPLASQRISAQLLQTYITKMGARYMADRSNNVRHIYYSRRLRRWLSVSNAGGGMLLINQYSECPCGATS